MCALPLLAAAVAEDYHCCCLEPPDTVGKAQTFECIPQVMANSVDGRWVRVSSGIRVRCSAVV